ncbi:exosortase A [Sphingomonas abietis]|uniref:Exosortase A n=1 Tax=Sphingomonas abietis TaxID=3012344 RepID=A0ABY7NSH4_9SPHN|nr:exosortase A [Sphingomonas abietis]WBO24122.1 exosortase A [Sphingomonas abietis]
MSETAGLSAIPARPMLAGWRVHLAALGLVVAALLLLFARDAGDMAWIWWDSSTYEHCLVIIPIIGWLVWQRLPMLRAIAPQGWPLPLAWIAIGGFGWLLGEAAGVAVARQLGLVMMLQGAVATTLGRGATAGLLFPLFYAFFLVPFGDAVIPALQTVTARLCMILLHMARVPATIDGVFINTPGGWFKVAEACSGAKFLIAMIALGVLVAHLGFRSRGRRAVFMLVCVIVPVIANAIRAFGTIFVAQYRGAQAAAGFDHVVYGWIFFAVVIAVVLAASWRFFDKPADAPAVDVMAVEREAAKQRARWPLIATACATLAVACAAPLWSLLATGAGRAAPAILLPAPPGWAPVVDSGVTPWRPRFDGAQMPSARYRNAAGEEVDVVVAYFESQGQSRQGQNRSLVGFGHGAVDPDGNWSWVADLPAPDGGRAERIVAPGQHHRVVVSFYDVGGVVTGSAPRVKIETLKRHLFGGPQYAAALLVSADEAKGGRQAVDHFLGAIGPIGPAFQHMGL